MSKEIPSSSAEVTLAQDTSEDDELKNVHPPEKSITALDRDIDELLTSIENLPSINSNDKVSSNDSDESEEEGLNPGIAALLGL